MKILQNIRFKEGKRLFKTRSIDSNYVDIEKDVTAILSEIRGYKICLVDDEVYLTTSDFLAMSPKKHIIDIFEPYEGRFIGSDDYIIEMKDFTEAFEVYRSYVKLHF